MVEGVLCCCALLPFVPNSEFWDALFSPFRVIRVPILCREARTVWSRSHPCGSARPRLGTLDHLISILQ